MKKAIFWDVVLGRYCVNRRFGGMYHLHLQGRRKKKKICERGTSVNRCPQTNVKSNCIRAGRKRERGSYVGNQ
jgi:hypothetical protein